MTSYMPKLMLHHLFFIMLFTNLSNASGGPRSAVKIVFGVEHEPKITLRKDYIAFPIL
jgi:hypothetical protein